jgi:DNA-binding transcriptional LysR family regulator
VELRQLRYFVAVAEERHFGRAASRLHIATPSLSQQIRALERDLRVRLLDRESHGLALTPAGDALLLHARALLTRAERARDDVRSVETRSQRLVVRVGTGVEQVAGTLLREVVATAPRLEVSMAVTHACDAVHAVREERADAAIVWLGAGEEQGLAQATLLHVPVHLVVGSRHRLATRQVVPVAELAEETVVLFPRELSPAMWDRIVGHLRPGLPARSDRVVVEPDPLGGLESPLTAVAAGRGVSAIAPLFAARSAVPGIVACPLDPSLTVPLGVVWREPADTAVQQLLALLAPTRARSA